LLSGELVAGVKAIEAGIVNQLFDAAILENSVYEFGQKLIRNNSGEAMETTKKMIAEVQSMPLETALDYAAKMNALARNSEDCKKGVKAFLDKQNISW
jgi:methylglutaconyl-CoA hydratase